MNVSRETSAEVKTRRLIVTVPDVSGEEIDNISADIEHLLLDEGEPPTYPGTSIRHALGESLPPHTDCWVAGHEIRLNVHGANQVYESRRFTQSEARSLAGALLAAADQLAEGTPS